MAATGPSSPDTTKETPAGAAAAIKGTAAAAPAPSAAEADGAGAASAPPTYRATRGSAAYAGAKQLLAAGALDEALSALEVALQRSRATLAATLGLDGDDESVELHESLAPLYYLYGTTLLYSVEESDDMMASGQRPEDAEVPPADPDDAGGEEQEAADPAEDLQIAWENLDLARSIVSRLTEGFCDGGGDAGDAGYNPDQRTELLLDLAQIHARLGDLQRANANVLPSLEDYRLALKLRLRELGRFDRRVADVHFSLAAAYAEAPQKIEEEEGRAAQFVQGLGGAEAAGESDQRPGRPGGTLSEEERAEFRAKSLEHYLACGAAFAGLMAEMCGEDAAATAAEEAGGVAAAAAHDHSDRMAALRRRVGALRPPAAAKEGFDDLREMLDEIQEAIDEAGETEEGLRAVGALKAAEVRKHEAPGGAGGAEGGATTIGFGAAAGDASAAAAATAPTMMVVKKKKKKPPAEEGSLKRTKPN